MRSAESRIALALFAASAAVYLADERPVACGDSRPAAYLAASLAHERDADLDEFPSLYRPDVPYYLSRVGGHVYSAFPLGPALLDLPFHVLIDLAGGKHSTSRFLWEEVVAASLVTAGSVAFLYLALRGFASRRAAAGGALLYAFGTAAWSTNSMNLWQHGPSCLFTAAGLAALAHSGRRERLAAWAGLPLGLGLTARPPNAIILAALGLYVLARHPRRLAGFVLASMPGIALWAGYNLATFGSPLGGYAFTADRGFWLGPFGLALAANLASPNRGIFFSSPVLLFTIGPMLRVLWSKGEWLRKLAILAAGAYLAVCSKYSLWSGGWCFGPRYTADLLPLVCLFLPEAFGALAGGPVRKAAFVVLAASSIAVHAIGVRSEASRLWNAHPDVNEDPERRVWDVRDAQVAAALRYGAGRLPRTYLAVWFPSEVGGDVVDDRACAGRPCTVRHARSGRGAGPGTPGGLLLGRPLRLGRGAYEVGLAVRGRCDPAGGPDDPVVAIEVLPAGGGTDPIASRALGARDLFEHAYAEKRLPFVVPRGARAEFRVVWNASPGCEVWIRSFRLDRIESEPRRRPGS